MRLAQGRQVLEAGCRFDRDVQHCQRGIAVVAHIRKHCHRPSVVNLVEAAGVVRVYLARRGDADLRIRDAAGACIKLRADCAVVVLGRASRRLPQVTEHLVHERRRAGDITHPQHRFGQIGACVQQHLGIVVRRQQRQRLRRELARRHVVAHRHQRRGQVGNDCRQLRRQWNCAQRFERLVQIANCLVDAVGIEVRRTQCVDDVEAILRRKVKTRFRIEVEQDFACRQRRLLLHQQARKAGAGKHFAATIGDRHELVERSRQHGPCFGRPRREKQMEIGDRQFRPGNLVRVIVRLRKHVLRAAMRVLRVPKVQVPEFVDQCQ